MCRTAHLAWWGFLEAITLHTEVVKLSLSWCFHLISHGNGLQAVAVDSLFYCQVGHQSVEINLKHLLSELSGSACQWVTRLFLVQKKEGLSWGAAWFSCSTSLYCLLGKIWGEHTLFCRGARADIYGAYFWLNSFESCSFPAPVSMGCWDEVNFKPYKRCHKLRVMANIFRAKEKTAAADTQVICF